MMSRKGAPDLSVSIGTYVEGVRAHVSHMRRSDNGNAYRAFLSIVEALGAIRLEDDRGRTVLTELLAYEDDNVRCWAAAHLLPLDEAKAVVCLERLSVASSGNAKYEAPLVLQEWYAGRLSGRLPVR